MFGKIDRIRSRIAFSSISTKGRFARFVDAPALPFLACFALGGCFVLGVLGVDAMGAALSWVSSSALGGCFVLGVLGVDALGVFFPWVSMPWGPVVSGLPPRTSSQTSQIAR